MRLSYRTTTFSLLLVMTCISPAFAQDANQTGLQLVSATRLPQSRLQPGGVLVLQATVCNTGSTEAEGVVVVTLGGFADRQSARRVAVAPNQTEPVEVYMSLPNSLESNSMADITVTLLVDYGDQQVIQDKSGQPAEYTLSLRVLDEQEPLAAFVTDPEPASQPAWYWPKAPPHASYEFPIAARIDAGHSRMTSNFDRSILPLSQADWAMIDVVVVSEPGAFDDAAFTETLRQYVAGGGKAWIMLDRVPIRSIRPLLGANQVCELIDTVALNSFTMEQVASASPLADVDLRVSSTTPFKFKRVVQSGGRVTHKIDGWPAAIWMKCGYGELLLTTLDGTAWIEPRESPSLDPLYMAEFKSRMWANLLAVEINAPSSSQPLALDLQYPLQHIGNPVVPKAWVTLALCGFCVLLAVFGSWRALNGELGLVGFVAPGLAVMFSAGLLFASTMVRSDIPEGVAKLQVVQIADDGQSALAQEQAAVYLASSADMNLASEIDGRAVASEQVSSGIQRFEVLDFQKWRLSNAAWPTGTWRYRTHFVFPTNDLVADAKLTDQGVRLELPELPSPLEDPVLSFTVGDPMLCQAQGSSLLFDGSLNAGDGRWMTDTLIDDEQQRRSEVYQTIFNAKARRPSLDRVLYGWTELWPQSPNWSRDFAERGSALVLLPVRLARPEVGVPILIPHGLVQLRRNPNQLGSSFAFDERIGKWQDELTMGVAARLQLVLPSEVIPFEASSIEMSLDMAAPHRNVRLLCELPSGTVELWRIANPSVPQQFTITDPLVLEHARGGTLDVTLEISERTDIENLIDSTNVVAWQVDDFDASFRGRLTTQ